MRCKAFTKAGPRCKNAAIERGLCRVHGAKRASARKPKTGPSAAKSKAVLDQTQLGPSIRKVLKQVHPDLKLATAAAAFVGRDLLVIGERLLAEAEGASSRRKKVASVQLQKAAKKILPRGLLKLSVAEATRAVTKLQSAAPGAGRGRHLASRAGLVFSVSTVWRRLGGKAERSAQVYLAAVLEALCAAVLEAAGDVARAEGKSTISLTHVRQAIMADPELGRVFVG